ncbi:hypothetical protein [Streptomyces sp. NPDC058268]|uniref:hypothetical protein n=1 Tax=Streptomyces sp. NPDC058268 TaxID=3346413 RepID=UPI0036ED9A0B
MPKQVQLVQFDSAERDVLLEAGQPKEIERAVRAVAAKLKQQLKDVTELASEKNIGASPEQLNTARTGLTQSLSFLRVCPAGEVADLLAQQEQALALIEEAATLATAAEY